MNETKATTPTKTQLDLMRHAVGSPRYYRNYFAASVDSPDCREWESLVELGLATRGRGPCEVYPYQYFHVSDEGRSALRRAEGGGE